MTRNLIVICSLIVIAFAVGALVRVRPAQDLGANTSGEARAIRETILKARRIQLEAEYTFDTSQFATVYINDPRGGDCHAGFRAFYPFSHGISGNRSCLPRA